MIFLFHKNFEKILEKYWDELNKCKRFRLFNLPVFGK